MQTMNQFFNQYFPRAMHFGFLASLIYVVPVVYAIGINPLLFSDYALLAVMFLVGHVALYLIWYTHPEAALAESKVQLLFYMGIVFCVVMGVGFANGLFHPEIATLDRLFFGYVATPTLYSGLALVNYTLFVWSLKIL